MLVFYDWPSPHMCSLQRTQPISLLILGSVSSDRVVFYRDRFKLIEVENSLSGKICSNVQGRRNLFIIIINLFASTSIKQIAIQQFINVSSCFSTYMVNSPNVDHYERNNVLSTELIRGPLEKKVDKMQAHRQGGALGAYAPLNK